MADSLVPKKMSQKLIIQFGKDGMNNGLNPILASTIDIRGKYKTRRTNE